MIEFLFKYLLSANYSFAKRWVNKKMPQQILPATIHTFTTPFTFVLGGLYFAFIGSINYKFETYTPIFIGLGIVLLPVSLLIEKKAKKAIYKWEIEKEYEILNKNQRSNRNTFAFLFFWAGFALFFYLGVTFVGGYLVK
jgi:nitrate reductase NapE component